MEPTLPVLPRIDRLDRLLQMLEEKHSKSTRFGSTTTNNGSHDDDDDDDDYDHEDNHKEKLEEQMNCKTLLSALDDVHHKGTLIDRLSMLESRVLKLILDMEERSTSRSSSSTAYATREENELPVDNCAKKTIGEGKRKVNLKWMRWFSVRC
ncbi:uncharacterized protein LOC111895828 [Lactuca sativa]|uniref:Uncharacterized protein n=1 Tax=Lactuca sativa TaxID=4236 RepID=A0A9R1W7C4_LACSA|nr:uncharacterized protein LOC111895828 [Lactuca sativa]KAJ0217496.1 hypothetical protein LSAT_V11C300128240 [Lactuca sativa]